MIKVGSRVKFISDTGVGVVRSIKGNLAYVEVEDGFEIPAMLSDIVEVEIEQENAAIVKIGPSDPKPLPVSGPRSADTSAGKHRITTGRGVNNYGRVSIADEYQDDEPLDLAKLRRAYSAESVAAQNAGADQAPAAKPVPITPPWEITDYLVKLLMVPTGAAGAELDMAADLDAYLVNDSSYSVFYNIARRQRAGYYSTLDSGSMAPDSKVKIRTFKRSELSEVIYLRISLLPHKVTSFTPRALDAFDLELHPLKFVRENSFVDNDYFDSRAVCYTLADSSCEPQPEPTTIAGDEQPVIARAKESRPAAHHRTGEGVIDLHADEILESTAGMTPGEIITAQLARFTIALDGAIKAGKATKLVFIHGMGRGKLRYELEKILRRDYSKLRYQDASFEEYGYGAIVVFVK